MKILYFLVLSLILIYNTTSQNWLSTYGITGENKAYAITVDNNGDIYSTGFAEFSGQGLNMVLLKYNSNGQLQWAENFNGTAGNDDKVYAVTVDANNFIYIAGYTNNIAGGNDITVLKYNSNGILQWVYNYSSPGANDDKSYGIIVDGSMVYVGGYVTRVNGADYAVIALNNVGILQWIDLYNGPGNGDDKVYAITVDNNGYLAVTGSSMGLAAAGLDYCTISYNLVGNRIWTTRYNGTGSSDDIARSIGVDGNRVVVTGSSRSFNAAGAEDYLTIEYDNSGVQTWVNRYNGTGGNEDIAYSLARDGGYTYVAGSSRNGATLGTEDIVTLRINAGGAQVWSQRFDGGTSTDIAYSNTVSANGFIYITGSSKSSASNNTEDVIVLKYNNTGSLIWNSRYNGPNNRTDAGTDITTFNNDVFITGYAGVSGSTNSNIITAEYSQGLLTTLTQISNTIPSGFILKQNYPNPFNPSTRIDFSIPVSNRVKIALFDVLGNQIDILVNQTLSPGNYSLDYRPGNLSSGIYIYRMYAGEFSDSKKLIIIK